MTFGADKRLGVPLLLKFSCLSAALFTCLLGALKNVNNSFLHFYHWCQVCHSVHCLYRSHTLDCHWFWAHLQQNPHLLHFHCYFHSDWLVIHHLNQAAGSVLARQNLGLVSLFLYIQCKNMMQICKTRCDLFVWMWEIAISVNFRTPLRE